ncbi:DUF6443 domain-containing protein [Pedobacter sp. FW305-3-2-15-E-R2A2]|uniref:DUF6443 domain-containing protein n=1 Tax=Pedobacter sp. FW305-3-2-15-E-R2A2 TaxID=3140251 RepID=UPI00314007E7
MKGLLQKLTLLLLSGQLAAFGQSADQNYIKTAKVQVSGITTEAGLNSVITDKTKVQVSVSYLDGLGRPMQQVQYQWSPLGKDVILPFAYDDYGREAKKYLPYTDNGTATGNYRAAALGSQQSFYNSPPAGVISIPSGSGQVAYSETKFEASPLSRVQQQGFPGGDWKINGGHTLRSGYAANVATDVRMWKVTANGATGSSYYPKAKLYVDTLTDENGNKSVSFKDDQDRLVLKRVQGPSGFLSTYYVYDELNNLRYVIPPGFSGTSFIESDAAFDQFIYGYHYNGKRLMTEKKLPGKGWEFLVYNKLDKLVMSQDAVQRSKTPQQWTVFKYDELGRAAITGIYSHTGSSANTNYRSTQQTAVDGNASLWETSVATGTGYTANTYPTSLSQVLLISYYDNYTIPDKTGTYDATQTVTSRTQGLATGTKVNILGTGTMLLTVNYYDERGRLKESISDHHLSGTDRVVNTWDFTGDLTASVRTHSSSGGSVTVAMRYEYDHSGRKTKTYQKINTDAEVLLSEVGYNELGQESTRKLHNGLQTVSMSYNSRGWLTHKSASLLAIQLKYNDGSVPRYNGDVTGQLWGTPGNLTKNYAYNYDQLGRLLSGISGTGNDEKSISYDVMGNILSLTRDNGTAQSYSYSGNRLSSVSGGASRTYTYDLNGNVLTDGTNTFTYNYLNLPQTVSGGTSITYTYDAGGRKLRAVNAGVTVDYIGGIQYTSGAIDFIQTEEGRARKSGSSYLYEYNLSDHLGNNRLSFDIFSGAAREIQHDDYYPFGKRFNGYLLGAKNNYLYNDKELQDGLGQYDYGARFYDPVIGRWTVIDPLAEQGRRYSPYVYVFNNPLRFTDPDGMFADGWSRFADRGIVDEYPEGPKGAQSNEWIPGMDSKGNLTLKAEKGDDPKTLAKFLGVDQKVANKLYSKINKLGSIKLTDDIPGVGTMNSIIADTKKNPDKYNDNFAPGLFTDANYNCFGCALSVSSGRFPKNSEVSGEDFLTNVRGGGFVNVTGRKESYKFGMTIVSFGKNYLLSDEPNHAVIYLGTSRNGTQYAFSKNGYYKTPKIEMFSTLKNDYGSQLFYYNKK